MFKCGEKCTGILAAEARRTREKVCLATAIKENDAIGAKRAARKVKNTDDYIKIMEEWPPAVNLAIGPALMVARIRSPEKQAAIMRHVQRAQDSGVNPMNGLPLGPSGVTGVIIKYLIAKHDRKPFAPEKRIVLSRDNINIINFLMGTCQGNQKATNFLKSLKVTA